MAPPVETENLIKFLQEQQKPIYHTPIDLGIKKFKRQANEAGLSKRLTQKLISAFKKRAWMDYEGIARDRGSFPTHPEYGKSVEIMGTKEEYKVKVNGK